MASDDVSPGDMTNPELSESELEALLTGLADNASVEHPVATFFDDVRSAFDSVPPPSPTHALSEYLGVSASTPPPPIPVDSTEPTIDLDLVGSAPAGRSFSAMIPALTAFIGTTVGKVALGGTIALAAATGAQATGIVDVPGLPDRDATAVVQTADDSSSTSSTSTTSSTSSTSTSTTSTTSTTAPAGSASPGGTAQPSAGLTIPFTVDGVGSVTVALLPTRPALVSTTTISGWAVGETSEAENEVEVEFTDGSNRVDVEFEYEDGQLRVRVRDRSTGVENFTWFSFEDGSVIRTGQTTDSDDDSDDDSDHDDDDDSSDDDNSGSDHDDDDDLDDDDDDSDSDDDDDDDDSDDNSGSGSDDDDDDDDDEDDLD